MITGRAGGARALWLAAALFCAALEAREPRAHGAALPDWSGLWQVVGVTPDATGETVETDAELHARFFARPPYTPAWQARYQAAHDNPSSLPRIACTWGVPMLMLQSPLMFEVLNTPAETAMIFSGREIRHIYTDGRGHFERVFPTHWGDSIGRWEGQTLVIDTIAVDSPTLFVWDRAGGELMGIFSSEVHYVERLRRVGRDQLEDQLTIIDPLALTRPWTLTHRYRRVTGIDRMIHEDCEGNDRNPIIDGRVTLTQP